MVWFTVSALVPSFGARHEPEISLDGGNQAVIDDEEDAQSYTSMSTMTADTEAFRARPPPVTLKVEEAKVESKKKRKEEKKKPTPTLSPASTTTPSSASRSRHNGQERKSYIESKIKVRAKPPHVSYNM